MPQPVEQISEEPMHKSESSATSVPQGLKPGETVTAQKGLAADLPLPDGLQASISKKVKVENPSLSVENKQLPSKDLATRNVSLNKTRFNNLPVELEEAMLGLAKSNPTRPQLDYLIEYFGISAKHLISEAFNEETSLYIFNSLLDRYEISNFPPHRITSFLFDQSLKREPDQYMRIPPNILQNRIDLVMQICKQNQIVPADLSLNERNDDLYRIVCANCYEGLESIPKQWRTPELCHLACEFEAENIKYAPASGITPELCENVCRRDGNLLQYIPESFKTHELCLLAYEENPSSLKFFSSDPENTAFLASTCRDKEPAWILENTPDFFKTEAHVEDGSKGKSEQWLLQHLPDRYKNYDLCLKACVTDGKLLKHVPTEKKTPELCEKSCKNSFSAFHFVPEHMADTWIYDYFNEKMQDIKDLPAPLLDKQLIAMHVRDHGLKDIKAFPEHLISRELCWNACRKRYDDLAHVPEKYLCPEFIHLTIDCLPPEQIHIAFKYCRTREDFHSVIRRCIPRGIEYQLACLTDKLIPEELKLEIIKYIKGDASPAPVSGFFAEFKADHYLLSDKQNPLQFSIPNRFLIELLHNAYQTTDFEPHDRKAGLELEHYIKERSQTTFRHQLINPKLFTQARVVGGRTLQITQDGTTYFKFQREGESAQELAKEGLTYQFLEEHLKYKKRFKSTLPTLNDFYCLPLDVLPEETKKFDDKLKIIFIKGDPHVNVLSFTAPSDYSTYAHTPEAVHVTKGSSIKSSSTACKKPEQGNLNACHDIGVLFSMGIVLTSTLPAYHNTESKNLWHMFMAATGYGDSHEHPGTFGAWNTDATSRPDFGWQGIRDIGDNELFGAIESRFLKSKNDCRKTHPESVSQRLALANAIAENMLAANLLRARLRQQFSDYHYKNTAAIEQTKDFIASTLNQFLAGVATASTPTTLKQRPESLLQAALAVNDDDYQTWLTRAATEVVYWTARQSTEAPPVPVESGSHYDYKDCYAEDYKKGRLCQELFPEDDRIQGKRDFRSDFYNCNQKLNLGRNNCSFPLLSLCNGLTRMCASIFTQSKP